MPAERVLADQLRMSRASLRKGLAVLESEGLLNRQVGRGTFLRGAAAADVPPTSHAATVSLSDAATEAAPRDLLSARLTLEPRLARLAARDATGRSIEDLRSAEALVASATDWPSYDAADEGFHRALAAASGNPILLHLFEALVAVRGKMTWGRLAERETWAPDVAKTAAEGHARIREAVIDRDAEAAEAALAHHIMVENATILAGLV